MFEGFSQAARQVVVSARTEAMRTGQPTIGCEHLLLALLVEHGAAGQALTTAGLDLNELRARVAAKTTAADAAFGRGALDRVAPGPSAGRARGRKRMTAEAKKSLQLALQAATALRQRQITTGHLLIGIIDQKDNAALRLLADAGADAGALRADVLARMAAAA